MVTGSFPCVRVGKITEAMSVYGWKHDVLCAAEPPQMDDVYNDKFIIPGVYEQELEEVIKNSDASIIHIHNEPNWPVEVAKRAAGDRPVILNVHDLSSARPFGEFDPYEESSFKYADALIFVTHEQRQQAIKYGFDIDKPYRVIGNYTSSRFFMDSTPLPHVGGLVYEGGIDERGASDRWRDQSPVADVMESAGLTLNIYSDRNVSYGTQHPVEVNFPILLHRLAQYDWGWCGVSEANDAWEGAIPNKFFDYMAAGIPVIAMNCPQVIPFCDMGFGVYVDELEDIPKIVKTVDRRPFIKAIKEGRERFTMIRHIEPIVDLYKELTCQT